MLITYSSNLFNFLSENLSSPSSKQIYSPDGSWDDFDQVGTTPDDYVPVYEILWGQANQDLSGGFYSDWPFNRPSNGTTEYDELYGYAHNNSWRNYFGLSSSY